LRVPGLRISAHSAGVSVSAVIAESSVEIVIVIANCLYSVPVTPPRNAIGTNTAQITAVTPRSRRRCPASPLAPPRAHRGLVVHDLSTASTTTIASSDDDADREHDAEQREHVDREAHQPACRPIVPINDTGMASIGMIVARMLPRNRYTTISTSTNASTNVWRTSSIEASTNTGGVVGHAPLDVARERPRELGHLGADLLGRDQRVAAGPQVDAEARRRLAVEPHADLVVLGAQLDAPDVAHAHHRPIGGRADD